MNRNAFLGLILVALGLGMFFLGKIDVHTGTIFTYFWPSMFVIPLGLFFHWLYFSVLQRRGVGVLVPGGILLVTGIVCQISMLFNSWDILWPGFILAVAAGLFELYWFGGRNKWLLIPINILTVLSVLFFSIFSVASILGKLSSGEPIIALLLIGAGVLLMFKRRPAL
ncbi:hypothetical protein [Gorillibacterium sp. sgz5001074]|uniref:hypothetical protein n=1 Tax=Gorillibacterium sp. sgz5001074 TaxID=3446695 RepID=UPI003F680AA1